MSARLELYDAAKAAIEAITTINVRDVNTFNLWNSQTEHEEEETSFNVPAVFIEYAVMPWERTNLKPSRSGPQGNIDQQQHGGIAIITFHCVFNSLDDVNESFPIIDPILEKIYFALQGLNGTLFTSLMRIEERQDVEHGRVIDWQMDFTTSFIQCGEEDESLTGIAADVLDLEIEPKDLDIEPDTVGDIRSGPEQT